MLYDVANWYTIEKVDPGSEASDPVVTAEELHTHLSLNVDIAAVRDQLEFFVDSAVEAFEFETGRSILPTTWVQYQTGWEIPLRLMKGKPTDVVSVQYYDGSDVLQTLEDYDVDLTGTPGLVFLPDNVWPVLSVKRPRPVVVEFMAGWETVPSDVRLAVLCYAATLYQYREHQTEANLRDMVAGWARVVAKYSTGLEGC